MNSSTNNLRLGTGERQTINMKIVNIYLIRKKLCAFERVDRVQEVSHEDGSVLFSKLKEGRMPRLEEVLEALEMKLKADGVDPTATGDGRGCS